MYKRQSISFVGIYLALHIVKYDYNSTIIIIYKSRRRLWINQTLCTTGVSLCLAVYNLLSIMVIGKLSGVNNINWDTIESAFFKNTQTLSQTNIWQVIVLFFATTFLLNMITITIVIVSKWIFNNFFPGWIIVATLIWIDLSGGIGIPLIFNGMSIAYTPLLINMSYSGVFYGIVILTVFWIIGFVCSKEREFYDVF